MEIDSDGLQTCRKNKEAAMKQHRKLKLKADFMSKTVQVLLLIHLLARLCSSEPIPVLTIQSPDGDLIDCIKKGEQTTVEHSLFKNHKILETPTDIPYTGEKEKEYGWQIWHQNGTRCPKGSIPVRRVISHQNGIPSLSSAERATGGHEYAVGSLPQEQIKVYGTQVTMNVWKPHIEGPGEFSLGQTWVSSGSYDKNDLNSIEAGWQLYPQLYKDYLPRFFTFWTTDAYTETKCYNIRCPGFVQTSDTIVVEGTINTASIVGGTQIDLTIRIWKDSRQDCWWLGVVINGVLVTVGYWPTFIFTRLTDHADVVKWGGEITNFKPSGRHTRTEMGSGYFPDSGFGKSAYMRNLEIATSENNFQPVQSFKYQETHPKFYRADVKTSDNPAFGTHFYYGGSRVNPRPSGTSYLSRDLTVAFLCFSLLWFV